MRRWGSGSRRTRSGRRCPGVIPYRRSGRSCNVDRRGEAQQARIGLRRRGRDRHRGGHRRAWQGFDLEQELQSSAKSVPVARSATSSQSSTGCRSKRGLLGEVVTNRPRLHGRVLHRRHEPLLVDGWAGSPAEPYGSSRGSRRASSGRPTPPTALQRRLLRPARRRAPRSRPSPDPSSATPEDATSTTTTATPMPAKAARAYPHPVRPLFRVALRASSERSTPLVNVQPGVADRLGRVETHGFTQHLPPIRPYPLRQALEAVRRPTGRERPTNVVVVRRYGSRGHRRRAKR